MAAHSNVAWVIRWHLAGIAIGAFSFALLRANAWAQVTFDVPTLMLRMIPFAIWSIAPRVFVPSLRELNVARFAPSEPASTL